ncbi:unnamed protein product [Cochlearia groenlandica]
MIKIKDECIIPMDLILEILSRIPAKSIMKSRLVCKLWHSMTSSPIFINSIATRSCPCVLLIFRHPEELFVISSPVNQNNAYPRVNHQLKIPNNGYLRCYESIQGLVYLETGTNLMIWNPIMKHIFTLPKLEYKFLNGFLGYEPVEGKYKLLCSIKEDYKIGILTLGAQESWRILTQGVRYAFVESYTMKEIKHRLSNNRTRLWVSYEGRLALVNTSVDLSQIELWILEGDSENRQWIYKEFPSPSTPPRKRWKLVSVTDAGEFVYIYTPYRCVAPIKTTLHYWFRIVYFDPNKNTVRQVNFQGIAYDDICRLNEMEFDLMKDVSVIPNHVESLMCL